MVATDEPAALPCLRCGYDLTGLDDRRPCPECGLLSGFSRMDPRELKHNHPRWLRGLSLGAWLIVPAVLTLLLTAPAFRLLDRHLYEARTLAWSQRIQPRPIRSRSVAGLLGKRLDEFATAATLSDWAAFAGYLALALLPCAFVTIAMWLLTRPGRLRTGSNTAGVLRLLSLWPLVVVSLSLAQLFQWILMSEFFAIVLLTATVLIASVMVVLLTRHLTDLAKRAPAPLLAADSPIVGYTAAAAFVLIPLGVFIVGSYIDKTKGQPILDAIIMSTAAIVLSVLLAAVAWSLYLLVRYAIAFRRSARDAEIAYAAADAAQRTPTAP